MNTRRPKPNYYFLFFVIAIMLFILSLSGLSALRSSDNEKTSSDRTSENRFDSSNADSDPIFTQEHPNSTSTDKTQALDTTEEITEKSTTESTAESTTAIPETQPPATDAPETDPPETEKIIYDYGEVLFGRLDEYAKQESARANDDFFADTLFVGDSRTRAIELYGDIKNAKFYCYDGLGAQTAMVNKFIEENGEYYTIPEAIAIHQEYKKIYVCLGINEYYRSESIYKSKYEILIDAILASKAEDAQVYIYSMFPVGGGMGMQKSIEGLNNTHIMNMNRVAVEIAKSRGIHFVDVSEAFVKSDGCRYLDENDSFDGVHLYKSGVLTLCEYMRTHT